MQLIIRQLTELQPYQTIWQAMRHFTGTRNKETIDEIWLLEHKPVFTQGQAGLAKHIISETGEIPIIQTDRGGQITYHGPGQLLIYTLWDLKRLQINTRELVVGLEESIIKTLQHFNIPAFSRRDAPGVYTDDGKIASIGLRVRKFCSYHGIAFNLQMDLKPFTCINPCGFNKLNIKQLADYLPEPNKNDVIQQIIKTICQNFGYTAVKPVQTNLNELTSHLS